MLMIKTRFASIAVVALIGAMVACGDDNASESVSESSDDFTAGQFVPSADDEAIDPTDPPIDPDPTDMDDDVGDGLALDTSTIGIQGGNGPGQQGSPAAKCIQRKALSPRGLTFVIHISKNGENAQRELDHLRSIRRYIRARDMFMVEERSPILDKLENLFPCNRFHFIAYPGEMQRALDTGGRIEGIAVDWEGSHVENNSQAYSEDRLRDYVRAIRKAGKQPGFVPAWSSRFNDAAITRASNMDYELAQIQGSCVNAPGAFAREAKKLVGDFQQKGLGVRNIGFEISMLSYSIAPNHVGVDRAADCTRAAYGKGARAIYLYGNGHDHLPKYFQKLGKMGVRTPKRN